MAINRKLIHFKNKENFDTEVANGNILDRSIVFIQDSKEISTHGTVYRSINWSVLKNPWDELENGVYAVSADGKPVTYENADETCIAVALIVNDAPIPQKLMIEKYEASQTVARKAAYNADGASNTGYTYFYWGPYGTDVSSITNYTNGDGKTIPTDYTTWKNSSGYPWNDYNGKANTTALKGITDSDSHTTYANAATYATKFNETTIENQGYTDWYIPACGQLSLIYINRTAINNMLTAIGGTTFTSYGYWSSSEYSSDDGWIVSFDDSAIYWGGKHNDCLVRLVRDL